MCYQCRGQTLNEREQVHRTAAVGEANQTSSPRQSLSHLEMPIRETCTMHIVRLCNATLHCCISTDMLCSMSKSTLYPNIVQSTDSDRASRVNVITTIQNPTCATVFSHISRLSSDRLLAIHNRRANHTTEATCQQGYDYSKSSVLTNLTKTNRRAHPASHLLTVDC